MRVRQKVPDFAIEIPDLLQTHVAYFLCHAKRLPNFLFSGASLTGGVQMPGQSVAATGTNGSGNSDKLQVFFLEYH